MGCASADKELKPMELQFNEADVTNDAIIKALDSLTESATIAAEANAAVASLAKGQASITMSEEEYRDYKFRQDYVPLGMEKEFDTNYTGPILPVLRTAAAVSGYTLAEPAIKPIQDPRISINTFSNPLTGKKSSNANSVYDVIKAINAVHGERIKLIIHEELRILELSYR